MSKIMSKVQSVNQRPGQNAYDILKPMKGGDKARGFTVMETLIVLAVTGGLFIAIAATLAGRQQRTQFEQGINDIRAQIQQVINDVGTGFYPNTNNFRCTAGALGPSLVSGSTGQGENTGCIFIGKVMLFNIAGSDPEEYQVFTVAGLQRTSTGDEVTTYAAAMPKAVSPSTGSGSVPDAVDKRKLQFGLTTHSATYGTANTPIGAVAFANSLASYGSGTLVSGAQQVNVLPISGSTLNTSQLAAAQNINNTFGSSPVNPSGGIRLCFVSGGTNQSGLITIGSNGRQLSVTLSIKGNRTCA